jgi:hypothetical protein
MHQPALKKKKKKNETAKRKPYMYIKTKLLLHITGNINEFVRRNVKSNRTQKCIPVKKKQQIHVRKMKISSISVYSVNMEGDRERRDRIFFVGEQSIRERRIGY